MHTSDALDRPRGGLGTTAISSLRVRDLGALLGGYAATAWGALALRLGIHSPGVDDLAFFRYRRRWNRDAQRAFGFELHADGPRPAPVEPGGRGTLIVANHAGFADLNVLLCETPAEARLNFVAKKEVGDVPIFGWHMKRYGDLLFDRADPAARDALVDRALARLERGFSVGLFPEGTRSRDGRPRTEIHPALIDAAIRAGVSIQPVALAGTLRLIEDWRLPHAGQPVYARFGRARRDYGSATDVWADVLAMWGEIEPARLLAVARRERQP